MTTLTQWTIGLDGNWNTAGNWSAGKPNLDTDVFIYAAGGYTVTLGASGFANSITMGAAAAGAIFREKPSGSLDITYAFWLSVGTAILNASNTIGDGVLQAGAQRPGVPCGRSQRQRRISERRGSGRAHGRRYRQPRDIGLHLVKAVAA